MMKGTFQYCRTEEALKRMDDGDIVQHLQSEHYFKKDNGRVLTSTDTFRWGEYVIPMDHFALNEEWRSLSNLHYYQDLKKHFKSELLFYLTQDNQIVNEENKLADKTKKRWFQGNLLS